nr:hypothetical protein [Cytophagales bacterium]
MSDLIHEYEPLNWLIASLFTDKFIESKPNFSPFEFPDSDNVQEDEEIFMKGFEDYQSYQEQVNSFVNSNSDACDNAESAINAMKTGKIKIPGTSISDTGEYISPLGYEYASTHDFYLWANDMNYLIPAQTSFLIDRDRQKFHELESAFPAITPEQFEEKAKEPLWNVSDGILYLMARRRRFNSAKEDQTSTELFFKQSYLATKILRYTKDAFASNDLIPINDNADLLLKTVKPKEFVAWAKCLPLCLPVFESDTQKVEKETNITPDMRLMMDARDKYWSSYDFENPDPRRAPQKEDVVKWLIQEAENRNMPALGNSKAKMMDTIIRCPKSRLGGNYR